MEAGMLSKSRKTGFRRQCVGSIVAATALSFMDLAKTVPFLNSDSRNT